MGILSGTFQVKACLGLIFAVVSSGGFFDFLMHIFLNHSYNIEEKRIAESFLLLLVCVGDKMFTKVNFLS
jgi:hypothetical protein